MKLGRSYKQHKVSGAWDAIVIGSGLGGLAVAGLLARHAGKRVLVLERHYTAGGFTHTFTRPGWEWDVGVHYVGDVHRPRSMLRRVFDHLSDGQLAWADMGDAYDTIVFDDERYPLPRGRRAYRDFLVDRFPSQERAIDRYLERTRSTVRHARGFFMEKALPAPVARLAGGLLRFRAAREARHTVSEVLDELTPDRRLRAVLTGQYGDYGLPPGQASWFMHATLVEHYFAGGAYPVGGSSQIAATLIPGIEAAGGQVVTSAEVTEILMRGGRAVGVRLADGNELTAPAVISDAGWPITMGRLLPREAAERAGVKAQLAGVPPSLSHVSLYVGARGTTEELGLAPGNLWVYPGDDHDAQVARYMADPEAPLPVAYLSFPSAKDPDFASRFPGKSTMEVIGVAPYEWFARWEDTRWKKRGDDYDAFKQRLADRLRDALLRQHPQLRDRIEHAELSTPLSTRHFVGHPRGEIYGLSHVPARFAARELKPQTKIPGLYLTGADICTAGVGGALMGGVLAASVVSRRNLVTAILGSASTPAPRARQGEAASTAA